MRSPLNYQKQILHSLFTFVALLVLFAACSIPNNSPANNGPLPPVYKSNLIIWVEVPENTPASGTIQLVVLDEVTGLPYNQQIFDMVKVDDRHHGYVLPLEIGTILKYKFQLKTEPSQSEFNANGELVRYRMAFVDGPTEIHDVVSSWENNLKLATGTVSGTVLSNIDHEAIADILVSASGVQSITDASGHYDLKQLPVGTHEITFYALDGSFVPYKQKLVVAEGLNTPANANLSPNSLVKVTFIVTVPENTVPLLPIRLAGNLWQLGNRFQDLGGGISTDVNSMPRMTQIDPTTYKLSMNLPAGSHLRYTYTQGDAFWNSGHTLNGARDIHQLVLPSNITEFTIQDEVISWENAQSAEIWFDLSIISDTEISETMYIQFAQAEWMPPIPLLKIEPARWAFKLQSPKNIGYIKYRFCSEITCSAGNLAGEGFYIIATQFSENQFLQHSFEWNQ